jgi:pimeloyl-ACP methyl ester carboxylesterase
VDPVGLARIQDYVGRPQPEVCDWQQAVAEARAINQPALPDFSEQQWLEFTRGLYHEEDGRVVRSYDPAIARPLTAGDGAAVPPDLWPLFDSSAAIPMLVIRGETSDILAPACVEEMARRHPGLQVATIPRRGHAPMLTEEAAVAAVDSFLRGL